MVIEFPFDNICGSILAMKNGKKKLRSPLFIFGAIYLSVIGLIIIFADFGFLPTHILREIPNYDLIGHFVLYGIASMVCYFLTLDKGLRVWKLTIPVGPLWVIVFAVFEEFTQIFIPKRTFSLDDLAFSIYGILGFYILAAFIHWIMNLFDSGPMK